MIWPVWNLWYSVYLKCCQIFTKKPFLVWFFNFFFTWPCAAGLILDISLCAHSLLLIIFLFSATTFGCPEPEKVCKLLQREPSLCALWNPTIFLSGLQIPSLYLQENAFLGDYFYHFLRCKAELRGECFQTTRLDREGGISAGRGEAPEEFEPKFSPFPSLVLPPRAAMGIPRSLTMGIFWNEQHSSRKRSRGFAFYPSWASPSSFFFFISLRAEGVSAHQRAAERAQ